MKTRSGKPGNNTLAVEVTNVSPHGVWLLFDEVERFLPFANFPWFAHATIAQISRVRRPTRHHLYWPDLDIDLAVDSIDTPDAFPLVSRVGAARRPRSSPRRPAKKDR
jgi:hypothetical protein